MHLRRCGFFLLLSTFAQCQVPIRLDSFVKNLAPVHSSAEFSATIPRPAWQPGALYEPPAGHRTLLGKFLSGKTASLTLKELPQHRALLVRIEIVILCHWDGIWKQYGPDQWNASLRAGPTLLSTTFSNFQNAAQHFPDEVGSVTHPYQTGSTSVGDYDFVKEMGELGKGWGNLDATYHLWLAIEHSATTATFDFSGNFHDTPDGKVKVGESWAIAGCQVWAIAAATHPPEEALQSALGSLTNTVDAPSSDMIATLVLAGENGLNAIEAHLRAQRYHDLLPPAAAEAAPMLFDDVIKHLSHANYKTRQTASKELISRIPRHRKELHKLLQNHPQPETRIRIQQALAAFDAPQEATEKNELAAKEIVAVRLKNVLRLMTSPKATQWLAQFN